MELKDRLINKINRRIKHHQDRNLAIKEEVEDIRTISQLERCHKLVGEYKNNIAIIDVYRDILSDIQIFSDEELAQ